MDLWTIVSALLIGSGWVVLILGVGEQLDPLGRGEALQILGWASFSAGCAGLLIGWLG